MSICPDAMKCEITFLPSLLKLGSIVNFTVSFIASEVAPNVFRCMHGVHECIGNKQQLCIQNMYSQTVFMKYVQCQAKTFYMIPNNGERCAKETSGSVINWSDVQTCVKSNMSNELFSKSIERARLTSTKKSCTIYLNGKFWCMHDGFWSNCTEGRNQKSFIRAICSRFNGKNKPTECTTID